MNTMMALIGAVFFLTAGASLERSMGIALFFAIIGAMFLEHAIR